MSSGEWEDFEQETQPRRDERRTLVPSSISAPLLMISAGVVIAYLVILTDWIAAKL